MTSEIKREELASTEALRKRILSRNCGWDESQRLLAVLKARLDESEVETVLAYLSGYKTIPPTFREFVENDDFGGQAFSMYPFWIDLFEEKLFPTRYGSPYSLVINQSAIGTGKTFSSSVCLMYELCRFLHLEDPHDRYNLTRSTKLTAGLYTPTLSLGQAILLDPIDQMLADNPFFYRDMQAAKKANAQTKFTRNIDLVLLSRVQQSVGRGIFVFLSDETSEVVQHGMAEKTIRSLTRRQHSRFGNKDGTLPAGRGYIMSSAKGNDSVVESVIADLSDSARDRTLFVQEPQWSVKPDKFDKRTHPVFIGSETSDPFVYETREAAEAEKDPDIIGRIIEVPINVLDMFKANCVEALQDLAGVTTLSSVTFFPSVEQLTRSLSWSNEVKQALIPVGMKDIGTTRLIDYINVDRIKVFLQGREIFIHLDPALTGDNFGIAISYVDDWVKMERYNAVDNTTVERALPVIVTPVVMGLTAKPGSEIPFTLVEELILDLALNNIRIGKVTFDTFQSRQLQQRLVNAGFNAEVRSLDRNKSSYIEFRRLVGENRWLGPDLPLLKKEMQELVDVGSKIDHPPLGSKDLVDSACGSVINAIESVADRSEAMATGREINTLDEFVKANAGKERPEDMLKRAMTGGGLDDIFDDDEESPLRDGDIGESVLDLTDLEEFFEGL